MLLAFLVAIALSMLTYALSGARSLAYLLYFLAFLPFVSIDPESGGLQQLSEMGGLNVMLKMSVRLATSAALMLLLFRRRDALRHALRPACWPVVLYFLWACAGLLRAESPWVALFRLGELLVFFLIGVCLFLEVDRFESPRRVARWHCLALLPLCLATMYAARVNPEVAYHEGLGGLRLGHKFVEANVLGFAASVVMLWATNELREKRESARAWLYERAVPLVGLAIAAFILVYARSRTAMVTVVAGQFLLWFPFYRGDSRRRALFALSVLAALATVTANSATITEWFLRGDSVVDLMSGTGRTGLWRALISEQVPKAPILGTGYLTLSETGYFEHAGTWWTNAHNTYMFALVSTGIPGLIGVLAIVFLPLRATFRRVFASQPEDRASWVLLFALQAVVAITCITGFGVSGFPNPVMLFSYAIYLYSVATPRSAPAPARAMLPGPGSAPPWKLLRRPQESTP